MALVFQKVERVLHFNQDKPVVYQIAQQTIPAVKFKQLVSEVASSCSVNATMTKAVTEALIDRLIHYMDLGHGVQLGEFGTFKPVFTSKTRKTVDELSTEDVTKVKIRFYPGKRFKQMLSNISITELNSLEGVVTEETTSSGSSSSGSDSGSTEEDPFG